MKQVGIVYKEIFLQHDTGNHPENSERLRGTIDTLTSLNFYGDGRYPWIIPLNPRKATVEEIKWCHSPDLIQTARIRCEEAKTVPYQLYLDSFSKRYGETVASPQSYEAALYAAGGMFTAIDAIMANKVDRAFNLCRPPGHHSDYANARGFCIFNNIALAVNYLYHKYNLKKIVIVDFDAHAGNGTEDLINQGHIPADLLMISLHQHPNTLYPGTCYLDEIGTGKHQGKILNLTLAPNSGHESIKFMFKTIVLPAIREFQPEFLLISAGYDAHHDDPLTNLGYMEQTFTYMMDEMNSALKELNHDKILCTLEGGYNVTALSHSIANTIARLGLYSPPFSESSIIEEDKDVQNYNYEDMVPKLRKVLDPYWKSFKSE
ncbi:histone deacetylase family protein [Candidatus Harpocratesius sp.]